VTDRLGFSGTQSITIHVGTAEAFPPVIDSIMVSGSKVTVNVSDTDGHDLTVTFDSATGGLSATPGSANVAGGSGSADFNFSAADIFDGGSGTATFTVSDGIASDTDTSGTITVKGVELPADAVSAIPLSDFERLRDTVKMLVLNGPLADLFREPRTI
jgi:hypothetical protein